MLAYSVLNWCRLGRKKKEASFIWHESVGRFESSPVVAIAFRLAYPRQIRLATEQLLVLPKLILGDHFVRMLHFEALFDSLLEILLLQSIHLLLGRQLQLAQEVLQKVFYLKKNESMLDERRTV